MTIEFLKTHQEKFYVVFRVLVGFLFWQHGAQKLLGLFGGTAQSAFTLMWFAGVIEFFGGLLILFGLVTRVTALVGAIEMPVAYFKAHAAGGLMPIVNHGELALLYFATFLVLLSQGAGKYSLDAIFFKKKRH